MTIHTQPVGRSSPRKQGSFPSLLVIHATSLPVSRYLERVKLKNARTPHFFVGENAGVFQFLDIQSRAAIPGGDPDATVAVVFSAPPEGLLTSAQLDAAVELFRWVDGECMARYGTALPPARESLLLHRRLAPGSECPGEAFPLEELVERLTPKQYRARLDGLYGEREAERLVKRLRQMGFRTPEATATEKGWVIGFAAHDDETQPERTVQVLKQEGWPASVEIRT